MINPNTVSQILNAARIEEVVSDYVTLRKRGVNLIGLCPFHDEKTGSFTVSPAKGLCKCFGCGKGGNAASFIMAIENVSYPEALKILAKKYHIEVEERELTDREREQINARESMFTINDFAKKHFAKTLFDDPAGRAIGLSYFHERGFRDDIIKKFNLGFSLESWDAFAKTAIKAGYKEEYLVKTGLCFANDRGGLTDRFRGRVMFPVHTVSGKVVAFGGRVLKQTEKSAKYVNSPESEIYHKSDHVYGIYLAKQAIQRHDLCYLVEGYTDVISMHQAGIENVVASSGTALTPGQIRLIHRLVKNITIIYDGDKAGINAALKGIDLILEEGMNVKVLLLPDGEDPDSFARKQNSADFIQYINEHQQDFIRFKTDLLLREAGNDPIKRAGLIKSIVESISKIPDQIIRQVYVRECSSLLEIEEKVLSSEIAKMQAAKRIQVTKTNQQGRQSYAQPSNDFPPPDESFPPMRPNDDAPQPSTTSTTLSANNKFDAYITNLLQMLIKYGERTLYTIEETHHTVSVGEYILEELDRDHIVFDNPLFRNIIEEFRAHHRTPNFIAENHFKFHQDNEINQFAINLIIDRYTVSKVHFIQNPQGAHSLSDEANLIRIVPKLMFELKNSIVTDMMVSTLTEIKTAYEQKNEKLLTEAIAKKEHIDIIRRSLTETLNISPVVRI